MLVITSVEDATNEVNKSITNANETNRDLDTKKDGAVFILDNKGRTIITEKTKPFDISFSGVFYPKGIASRVISQRSIFTISHKPTVSFESLRGEFEIKKII